MFNDHGRKYADRWKKLVCSHEMIIGSVPVTVITYILSLMLSHDTLNMTALT